MAVGLTSDLETLRTGESLIKLHPKSSPLPPPSPPACGGVKSILGLVDPVSVYFE